MRTTIPLLVVSARQRIFALTFLVFFMIVQIPIAWAVPSSIAGIDTTPVSDSMAVCLSTYMFGTQLVQGVTTIPGTCSTPTEIVQSMSNAIQAGMSIYTSACFAFVAFIFSYWIFIAIMSGALTGNPTHQSINPHWSTMRFSLATAMLAPSAAGFSVIQATVLYLLLQGSGMADRVWITALSAMNGQSSITVTAPEMVSVNQMENGLFKMAVCRAYFSVENGLTQSSSGSLSMQTSNVSTSALGQVGESWGNAGTSASTTGPMAAGGGGTTNGGMTLHFNLMQANNPNVIAIPDACGAMTVLTPTQGTNAKLQAMAQSVQQAQISGVETFLQNVDPIAKALVNATLDTYDSQQGTSGIPTTASQRISQMSGAGAALTSFYTQYTGMLYKLGVSYLQGIQSAISFGQQAGDPATIQSAAQQFGWPTAGLYWEKLASDIKNAQTISNSVPEQYAGAGTSFLAGSNSTGSVSRLHEDFTELRKVTKIYINNYAYQGENAGQTTINPPSQLTNISGTSLQIAPISFMEPATWIAHYLTKALASSLNPLISTVNFGNKLEDAGDILLGATAVAAIGKVAGYMTGEITAAKAMKALLSHPSVAFTLIVVGTFLATIIPLVPVGVWVAFVFFWFVLVFEMVVSAPVWAVGMAFPEGEGISGRYGQNGLTMMLSVMFRPVLGIFGLLASLVMVTVAGDLVWKSYAEIVSAAPTPGGSTASLWDAIGQVLFFTSLWFILVWKSMELIPTLPDKMARMVGGQNLSQGEHSIGMQAMSGMQNLFRQTAGVLGRVGGYVSQFVPDEARKKDSMSVLKSEIDERNLNTGDNQAPVENPGGEGKGPTS